MKEMFYNQKIAKAFSYKKRDNVLSTVPLRSGVVFTTLHFLRKLRMGPISQNVCPWQAFPGKCNVILLDPLTSYEENYLLWLLLLILNIDFSLLYSFVIASSVSRNILYHLRISHEKNWYKIFVPSLRKKLVV